MKRILERLASAARLCWPAVMLCALGGRAALAAPAPPAPVPDEGTEWPETTSAPEESRVSDSMPEDIISTDAFRGSGRDSVSRSMPQEASLFESSAPRRRAPKGWKEDGQVTKAHAAKTVPGPGDLAYGRMKKAGTVQVGDLLYVLRRDVPTDAEADPDALYLERIGVARVESVLPKGRVRLRVLKSASEVSPADLLSRTPL